MVNISIKMYKNTSQKAQNNNKTANPYFTILSKDLMKKKCQQLVCLKHRKKN